MRTTLDPRLRAAWRAFHRLTSTPHSYHLADRALTLHLLEGHAPGVFRALRLKPALTASLRALSGVPREFPPALDWFEVMARVDALYLRALRGLRVPAFDADGLAETLVRMESDGLFLPAWLCAQLARPLGLGHEVRVHPAYWRQDPVLQLGLLTHVVLLETGYLARPLSVFVALDPFVTSADVDAVDSAPTVLEALREGLAWALEERSWDLLAELVFCLEAAGEPAPPKALAALRRAQRKDGHFEEPGDGDRERAHTTAACLIALAGAEGRARRSRAR